MDTKFARESRCTKTSHVFPTDTNNHGTLFGGKLMAYIDDTAALSAIRHCRMPVVTASTDSVDFLCPIKQTDCVYLESFVTWTGHSSMEVFCKVIAEDLMTGEKRIAATAFLTFVALNEEGKPMQVPKVIPETEEEIKLNETGEYRARIRKERRKESKEIASVLTTHIP